LLALLSLLSLGLFLDDVESGHDVALIAVELVKPLRRQRVRVDRESDEPSR
jgi:hypothetical protein